MKLIGVKRHAFRAISVGVICSLPVVLWAQSTYFNEYNKTIARLGVQGNYFYVIFAEPIAQNCVWGNLYIASDRKAMYAQLLSAKLAGRRLSRVDYSQPGGAGTQCNVELVELGD